MRKKKKFKNNNIVIGEMGRRDYEIHLRAPTPTNIEVNSLVCETIYYYVGLIQSIKEARRDLMI